MAGDVEKRVTAKYILDDSGFNDKLQGVNQQLKLNASELKNAQVGMQAFGKNSDSLKSIQQALATQIETQSKKVDIYRQSIEKVSAKMQENISQRDKLKSELDQEQVKLNGAIQAYGKESQVTQNVSEKVKELTDEYNDKQKAVEANAKSINNYTTNMNKADAELTKLQGNLNKTTEELNKSNSGLLNASEKLKTGSESFKNIGEGANNAGNKILGLTAPLVGIGIAAAKVGMDFDSQMSRVKAISGATGDEFEKLRNQAIQLGSDTAFNAQEAAQGMENLASAGFSTNEIMAAMPGMLDLAASSGEDLASSADIAASTLRGFGLAADQAGHVADVLAKNAATTNAAVGDTGEAMKYVAPVAHAMGLNLEQVTAAIGEMANEGIKGSDAGTALRGSLVRLASPSKESADMMKSIGFNAFDAHGKMLPLDQIINNLQKSTAKLNDEQKQNAIATIFGTESLSGMLSLVQAGPKQLNDLTGSLKNSNGAASEMAKTMQDNAKSSIEQMMGSIETAGIKLEGNFAPTIKSVADAIGNLADKFGKLSPETQKLIVEGVGVAVALGGTLKVVGGLASGISGTLGILSKLSGGIGAATVAAEGATVAAGAAAEATAGAGVAASGAAVGLGGLAVAAAPWLLAGAGIIALGVGIHHELTQEATPAVDLFATSVKTSTTSIKDSNGQLQQSYNTTVTKISDSTKQAVGAYMQLDDGAKKSLSDLYVNGTVITTQTVQMLKTKYDQMGAQIKTGMDKHYQDEYNTMQQFFQKSTALSDAEKATALVKLQQDSNNKKAAIDNYEQQIQGILQNALNNHRSLSLQEQQQINSIQEQMRTNAVNSLSATEVESKVILQRLNDYGSRITAEQASSEIKNANKARDESVNAANDQYNKTLAAIIQMRDGTHSITADQADKLIADAKRQKEESIQHAEELRSQAVSKITSMNRDIKDNVDTNTGNILTIWDRLKSWWNSWFPAPKNLNVNTNVGSSDFSSNAPPPQYSGGWIGQHASGTNYYEGGLTTMHEKGYEVYNLPRGSRIYNHEASEDLVKQTAESVATKVAANVMENFSGNNMGDIYLTMPIYLDNKLISTRNDKIQASQVKQGSRRRGLR